jgi:radical SAM protein with 4Fe4S-binding SPASM domain
MIRRFLQSFTRCSHGQFRAPRLRLQWHITERCNLRCVHCYQEARPLRELPFQELLKVLEQFKDLLTALGNQAGGGPARGHITVTGGEPFVRRDFLELLQVFSANRNCFSFAILTNGTFIDAAMAHRLHELRPSFVQVSIEGTPATHDRIRGPGNYEHAVSAVKHLVRERLRTLISFTAHRLNFREFTDVARLGRRLAVARVWADRLIPQGNGSNIGDQVLTPEETLEFFRIMRQARDEARRCWFNQTEIAMHRALQFLEGGAPYHCTAGDTLITVQPNGDLYPCRRMPIRVGNIMETPLVELYFRSDLFRALRNRRRVSEGCQHCFYNGLCRGGLKCLSYAMTGDPFQADPGCWLASTDRGSTAFEDEVPITYV